MSEELTQPCNIEPESPDQLRILIEAMDNTLATPGMLNRIGPLAYDQLVLLRRQLLHQRFIEENKK